MNKETNNNSSRFKEFWKNHWKDVLFWTLAVISGVGAVALLNDSSNDSYDAYSYDGSPSDAYDDNSSSDDSYYEAEANCEEIKPFNNGMPFDVSGHKRTLPNGWSASAEKRAEAEAMGIDLDEHQTFVNPFTKNDKTISE